MSQVVTIISQGNNVIDMIPADVSINDTYLSDILGWERIYSDRFF